MKALLVGVVAMLVVSGLAVLYFSFKTLISANAREAAKLAELSKKRRKPRAVDEKVRGAGASD